MQRSSTLFSIAFILLTTSAATVPPLQALAQDDNLHGLSGFWQSKFGKEPFGQILIDQLPEGALLINDAGDNELQPGQFAGLRLTERALTEAEQYDPGSMQNPDTA